MLYRLLCLFFVIGFGQLQSEPHKNEAVKARKVCLNMIVKNESAVIENCLKSVMPLIDYWVIVDTGSNDGTQEIIKKFMKDIPGELHERPWVNFAHNRNEALQLAKGKAEYLFLIDADETLSYEDNFSLPVLDKDGYYMPIRQIGAVDFLRLAMIRTNLPWSWSGVLHEFLNASIAKDMGMLKGVINLCNNNKVLSGRSIDEDKYLKDAAVLEEALKQDPDNARYVFYLAQSYWAAKKLDLALKNYEKRASMQSPDTEETYSATCYCGRIKIDLGDYEGALASLLKAYELLPYRAEPLHHAAIASRKMGRPFLGYLLSKHALTIPCPMGNRVEYALYEWAILAEFANCALLTGRWQEGLEASARLLSNPKAPAEAKQQFAANCEVARTNLNNNGKGKETAPSSALQGALRD